MKKKRSESPRPPHAPPYETRGVVKPLLIPAPPLACSALGINPANGPGLTDYQKSVLDKIRDMNRAAIEVSASGTSRSLGQVQASVEIHKRVNPGYVDMPYRSSNSQDFKYQPPPDFTRAFLKKDSDCAFQKYAAEAILKHVDLKKTSH